MAVTLQHLQKIGLAVVCDCQFAAAGTNSAIASVKAIHASASAKDVVPPQAPVAATLPSSVTLTAEEERLAAAMRRPLPLRSPSKEVSVISFNMLLKGFHHKPYYPSVSPELRAWPHRKAQLQQVILGMGADIYCMQEIECLSFSEEFAFLADAGYDSIAPKDDSKGKRPDMAKVAIFYKGSRLQKLWHETRSRLVIAAFEHLPSEKILYVVSCHLEGAPWHVATRFTQMQNALDSIRKHQKQQGIEPASSSVIFAGDFNEGEDGAVFRCLVDGGLSKNFRAPAFPDEEVAKADYRHEFQMSDLYAPGAATGSKRLPTFCAPEEETGPEFAAIDFVFYTHNTLRPAAVRLPFTDDQTKATTGVGIPSAWHFSDHVPVGGVFCFAADDGGAGEPTTAF